jgi:murein DD-endopeptidase MepM/ murein hydrolase activator NlpD
MVLAATGLISGVLAAVAPSPADAASTIGTVHTSGTNLNVRSGASMATAKVGTLAQGTRVTVVCQTPGQQIKGNVRTTTLWDRLLNGTYVSDAFIRRGTVALPRCAGPLQAPAGRPSAAWVMPVPATVGSAFRSKDRPTHDGVDLSLAKGTPIRAVSAGTVVLVQCNASTGNCDVDGGLGVMGCGWYVEIQHAQVISRYCHLMRQPSVVVGQQVKASHVIGYVGSSGNSSGPHLHFEIHVNTAGRADRTNAVDPVTYMRSKGVPMA